MCYNATEPASMMPWQATHELLQPQAAVRRPSHGTHITRPGPPPLPPWVAVAALLTPPGPRHTPWPQEMGAGAHRAHS